MSTDDFLKNFGERADKLRFTMQNVYYMNQRQILAGADDHPIVDVSDVNVTCTSYITLCDANLTANGQSNT